MFYPKFIKFSFQNLRNGRGDKSGHRLLLVWKIENLVFNHGKSIKSNIYHIFFMKVIIMIACSNEEFRLISIINIVCETDGRIRNIIWGGE